ncbi:MAG: hypothetical protein R3B48_19360 [Kofleriaceae bacterium]
MSTSGETPVTWSAPPGAGPLARVRRRGRALALSLRAACALGLALASAGASGCGPIRYVRGVTGDASDAVERAREANAAELAPYWWTRAVAYLDRARYEAAAADWQAANRFGALAERAALTAIEEAAAAKADPSRRPLEAPKVAPAKESSRLAPDAAPVPLALRRAP